MHTQARKQHLKIAGLTGTSLVRVILLSARSCTPLPSRLLFCAAVAAAYPKLVMAACGSAAGAEVACQTYCAVTGLVTVLGLVTVHE